TDEYGTSAIMYAFERDHNGIVTLMLLYDEVAPNRKFASGGNTMLECLCDKMKEMEANARNHKPMDYQLAYQWRCIALIARFLRRKDIIIPKGCHEYCTTLAEKYNTKIDAFKPLFGQLILCTDDNKVGKLRRSQAIR